MYQFLRTTSRKFSTPPVVKVLSLDARDTLIKMRESPSEVYSRLSKKYGLHIKSDHIMSNFLKNYKRMSAANPCFGCNDTGSKSWWTEVAASTLLNCSPDSDPIVVHQVAEALYDYYSTAGPWQLVEEDIKQTLQKIRLKGIHLVVTSNFDSRLKSLLTQFDLSDLFTMIVLSGEIGFEKPDPRIFQPIMNHFDLGIPSEILHIGDNLKNDFQGAKTFGCKALLYDPYCSSTVKSSDRISRLSSLKLY